jgi:hypothetical protein
MAISVKQLSTRPKQFMRATGLKLDRFKELLGVVVVAFDEEVTQKRSTKGGKFSLSVEAQLLLLLFHYRSHCTMFVLGMLFGLDASNVCRCIHRMEKCLYGRAEISAEKELSKDDLLQIIVDATEQRIYRPKRRQQLFYSGKKKCHTIKTEIVIAGVTGKIVAISPAVPGTIHDLKLRRQCAALPNAEEKLADSGYQGLQKEVADIQIPIKATKKKPLTDEEKAANKTLSSKRIKIEHAIGKMKQNSILSDRYRRRLGYYGVVTTIIAFLVNFQAGLA